MSRRTNKQRKHTNLLATAHRQQRSGRIAGVRTPDVLGWRRPIGRTTPAVVAAAALSSLGMACAGATPVSAQQGPGIGTHVSSEWHVAPVTVARMGRQIVRCDTGEGNLGGAEVTAPLTLPSVTTCDPSTPARPASAEQARQLEHDPLR